jgi:hypothetical protein
MMQKKMRGKLAALLVILLFNAACVETMLLGLGATAAIGTYKWIEGTMEKDYPRPMQDVFNASLKACADMKMKISSQQYGPMESKIEAVLPPDTTTKIQLIARPNQITTLKIRVGFMGNQDASAYFNRRVMHHLGLDREG